MAGRPRKFDDVEILEKAILVFWEKGYEAASADVLLKAMGIGKGSFYLHFGSKRELYIQTMNYFANKSITKLKDGLQQSDDKIEFIKNHFYNRLHNQDHTANYGCYIGNAIVEMSNLDPELQHIASLHLQKLENVFCEVVSEYQTSGDISINYSPQLIANYLVNLWNGMNISKRMNGNIELLMQTVEMNLNILE